MDHNQPELREMEQVKLDTTTVSNRCTWTNWKLCYYDVEILGKIKLYRYKMHSYLNSHKLTKQYVDDLWKGLKSRWDFFLQWVEEL